MSEESSTAAIRAANRLRRRSAWQSELLHFDAAKRQRLADLLQRQRLSEERCPELIGRTESAFIELQMTSREKPGEEAKKFDRLISAIYELKSAWAGLKRDGKASLFDRMQERIAEEAKAFPQLQRTKAFGDAIIRMSDRNERTKQAIELDLAFLIEPAFTISRELKANAKHNPALHVFTRRVALAWFDAFGKAPGRTGNYDEETGLARTSPFQVFALEALSPLPFKITKQTISEALQGLTFGDKAI